MAALQDVHDVNNKCPDYHDSAANHHNTDDDVYNIDHIFANIHIHNHFLSHVFLDNHVHHLLLHHNTSPNHLHLDHRALPDVLEHNHAHPDHKILQTIHNHKDHHRAAAVVYHTPFPLHHTAGGVVLHHCEGPDVAPHRHALPDEALGGPDRQEGGDAQTRARRHQAALLPAVPDPDSE